MLGIPGPSPLDLVTRLGGTQVRITPWFWLSAVLLGWRAYSNDLGGVDAPGLFGWCIVVFATILLHEMGHVWAFRRFGVQADVVLIAFGGLAVPRRSSRLTHGQQIVVSAAGPAAQLLLVLVMSLLPWNWLGLLPDNRFGAVAADMTLSLYWVSLFWAVLNLLPVFPLDGGWIARALLSMLLKSGPFWADVIGLIVGGLVAYFALTKLQSLLATILFAFFAYGHFRSLQQRQR